MRRKTRTKVKKYLKNAGIVVGIILIIALIIFIIKISQKPEISYDDKIVANTYFSEIKIDFNNKKVTKDGNKVSLSEVLNITKDQEEMVFTTEEELKKLLNDSAFDISTENQIYTIKNPYQTKCFFVNAESIKEKIQGEEIQEIAENFYLINCYSEKLTKAMYNYYKSKDYIKNIYLDEVYIDTPVSDISQTMYGETNVNLNGFHTLGTTTIGLDNYMKIISDNGNPADIVIATVGYGINYRNEIFAERISDKYYNFIQNNQEIEETIPQGSRIAEVLVDSTSKNIKILPLVTVTEEGYTSISSIVNALLFASKNSDVICYELINPKNEIIDEVLKKIFKEDNIPVTCVGTADKENYPANHGMTIAISSVDRENNLSEYSAKGNYIDFALPSTDIEEIFNTTSTISRWSGAQYSNAYMASCIALIKTYDKEATILDVYNFLRNFSIDLGENGKDELYGYGGLNFKNITIKDIDKITPEFEQVQFENETWEILKQIKILAKDNIRISSWAITKNENMPNEEEWKVLEQQTPILDVTTEVSENGTYNIWVKDSAENQIKHEIKVEKVDNTPPKIAYTINKDTINSGYVTINVTAEDLESGLYDSPFSWDKIIWSQENATKEVKENGRYTVYAEDNLGNISELEILVDVFPQAGTAEFEEGDIITDINVSADWTGNTNNNVKITLNKDIDITAWQITTSIYKPDNFVTIEERGQIEERVNVNTTNNIDLSNASLPRNVVFGNISNNQNTQNETNSTNVSNTSNTLNNSNESNTSNTSNSSNTQNTSNISNTSNAPNNSNAVQPRRRTEPIELTTSLEINKTYYFWIKQSDGNVRFQIFKINKAQI